MSDLTITYAEFMEDSFAMGLTEAHASNESMFWHGRVYCETCQQTYPGSLARTENNGIRRRLREHGTHHTPPNPRPENPTMANPQRPGAVTGYRTQPQELIDLANRVKAKENELGDLHAELRARDDVDPRMLALGRTNLQQGCMWTVRAIFQPESRL